MGNISATHDSIVFIRLRIVHPRQYQGFSSMILLRYHYRYMHSLIHSLEYWLK